jgi:hypothetical protein
VGVSVGCGSVVGVGVSGSGGGGVSVGTGVGLGAWVGVEGGEVSAITATTCIIPSILDVTKTDAPGPMWHLTHSTLVWGEYS